MKFRKRPVVVEAIQWHGPGPATSEVMRFTGTHLKDGEEQLVFVPLAYPAPKLWVAANNAWVEVEPGEWFIRDSRGVYPCKPDVFAATYEPFDGPPVTKLEDLMEIPL